MKNRLLKTFITLLIFGVLVSPVNAVPISTFVHVDDVKCDNWDITYLSAELGSNDSSFISFGNRLIFTIQDINDKTDLIVRSGYTDIYGRASVKINPYFLSPGYYIIRVEYDGNNPLFTEFSPSKGIGILHVKARSD